MAVLGQKTVNNILIIEVDADPTSSTVPAPIGSAIYWNASGTARWFKKTGAADANWTEDIVRTPADKTKLDGIPLRNYPILADMFDSPVNSNWAVNGLAPIATDSANAALINRQFVDAAETGVGFTLHIPASATNMVLKFRHRRQATTAGTQVVVTNLYRRTINDNAAVSAWSSANANNISIANNTNFHYDTVTVTLATLGLTADTLVQFELTRAGASGSDTLTTTWNLYALIVEFT